MPCGIWPKDHYKIRAMEIGSRCDNDVQVPPRPKGLDPNYALMGEKPRRKVPPQFAAGILMHQWNTC